ncbi:BTAD domain-containing putative transcriptional regulator [Streptomyces sp. NPDC057298]|uniref:AfsR/SARP family transcriptional regulator n=1 Tax=Streptomyces sp. NPDC057298 TaxID=3346091 RepID=UPI0036375957
MRFRLLGPLEIQAGDRRVRIAADKQRTIAAALLAADGRVVAVPSLLNEIWGEQVPPSAVPNLRTYVMRLRRSDQALGERLMTSPSGYSLRAEPDELDVRTFEDAAELGCKALTEGDAGAAASAFDHALAQWRGSPLEDVPLGPALSEFAQALGEHYARTVEDSAEAGLALGDHRGVVDRLRPFIERHPLRERAYGRLMLALYRGGDVQGAVRVFHRARCALREELGIDPGRELSQLLQAMLARDFELETPPPRTGSGIPVERSTPRQLPPSPTNFVGRTAELGHMASMLRADAGPVVVAIHGPGGIGKSALSLRAAHAVADHFPDGQLYVDLQGASSDLPPLPPGEVLRRFLRTLGIQRHEPPLIEAEAATLLQSLLADRRVLVVLDNATDASQVRPLLPAGRGCATIITSRPVLSTLDAEQIPLGELDHAEGVAALALYAGEARVAEDPEAVDAVARACGGHALATRIAGARIAARPALPIAWLRERLERQRLEEWSAGDLDLRACFAAGYETLPDATAARAFRLLGAVCGSADLSVGLVAALLGSDDATTEAALDDLVQARLLEAVSEGRFLMHPLIRLYAAELLAAAPHTKRAECFHGI